MAILECVILIFKENCLSLMFIMCLTHIFTNILKLFTHKNDNENVGVMNGFRSQLSCGEEGGDVLSEESRLQKTVEVLLPLLLQCWVEAGPAQLSANLSGNKTSFCSWKHTAQINI